MFQLIKNYVSKMTREDVINFTSKKGIFLSNQEVDFVYRFVKKNYEALYVNPYIDFSKYKSHFSEENYEKIVKLINECRARYFGN